MCVAELLTPEVGPNEMGIPMENWHAGFKLVTKQEEMI